MTEDILSRYYERVGYTEQEKRQFEEGGHRLRQVRQLAHAAQQFSIQAEVIDARNCNSGHAVGQQLLMDVDGNFITKFCPKKMCVYLLSQLSIPVALINERISEGLDPNDFHFMRQVQCPDAGVGCMGYGKVRLKVEVVPRKNSPRKTPTDSPEANLG